MSRYQVQLDRSGTIVNAELKKANQEDMPSLKKGECRFDWESFWKKCDFTYQNIVMLNFEGKCLGLVHFVILDNSIEESDELHEYQDEYIFVEHLERLSKIPKDLKPVGFWLIWYVVQLALQKCTGNDKGTIVLLDSIEESISYYDEQVKMEGLGWTTIAPGEDGYAFRFTKEGAENFCRRIEQKYGSPVLLE
jgi:hypothetical protein